MVLTVTEDTPADMLAGSMELLVQLPREHHLQMQRVTVQRSTPMMDLLVQIATAHKLTASNYTLQAIGERGMVLSHQPNTPIGALDALQVKLLPKQGTLVPRKAKQVNQPFETTFRLQVHLPRNQLYVSRVSPKMNLGEILEEVCREKDLDKNKYELRHPASLETLDLSLSLQDYHLQEVTLYARQGRTLGSALSTQDIMALQRQEERRRQQAKQGVFGFVFKKSKEGSLSTDSLGERSASPARSDETGRSTSPLQAPTRPQRKRRPAPKPPIQAQAEIKNDIEENSGDSSKDKVMISHSRNSSDSSGYHEASVLSDNPDSAGRLPETLPRRNKVPLEMSRKLAQTSQSSKSLNNLASVPGTLSHGISNTSLSSTGLRKKRVAPPPPVTRPLSSAISTQALERIVDSEESLTSDMDPSKPPSDIGVPSKANSDIEERPKANSDIGITVSSILSSNIDFIKSDTTKVELESKSGKSDLESCHRSGSINVKLSNTESKHPALIEDAPLDARVLQKRVAVPVPHPKPRNTTTIRPEVAKRKLISSSPLNRTLSSNSNNIDCLSNDSAQSNIENFTTDANSYVIDAKSYTDSDGSSKRNSVRCEEKLKVSYNYFINEKEVFMIPARENEANFNYNSEILEKYDYKSTNIKSDDDDDDDNNNDNRTDHKQKLNINMDKENIENSLNGNSILTSSDLASTKNTYGQEKKLCAVISTMPKCNHLNKLYINDMITQTKEGECLKDPKKAKIPRTASKSNDFEVNSLEKQKRHLTSHAEDITFALNLNVTSILLPDQSREVDKNFAQLPKTKKNTDSKDVVEEKSCITMGSSDTDLSETDVLLQKVFDTLSNSVSLPDEISVAPAKTKLKSKDISKETEQKNKKNAEYPNDLNMNTSTSNLTINSQQDTSDYVSTLEEDLSIVEWEYQLPAPPSAFRDNASPVFDNFEAITPISESLIDTKTEKTIQTSKNKNLKNIIGKKERQKNKEQLSENEVKKSNSQEKLNKEQKSESNIKKEVIYELKNKIGILPQSVNDVDSKKISNSSTSKIAPIDITLSNFTITTYSKQKNLNIFEEIEQFRQENSDDKFIRSFATLSRNRSNLDENENKNLKEFNIGTLQGKKKVATEDDKLNNTKKLEPKIQMESLQKWQYGNEKSNIQRSKSYMSICDKPNFQGNTYENKNIKNVKHTEMDDAGMKKAMSINNLNITVPKNNEKFSQWRDNILKRQENPTKEKELQSLQVLKSILPQLKNAQQAEENVSKDSNNTILFEEKRTEIMSNEYSKESNVVPTCESESAPSNKKIESETNSKINAKRYIYSGPPTINLGSWSERPSANVQIKMDIDYKFGTQQAKIVNVNNIKDEIETSSNSETSIKMQKNKFEITTSDKNKPNDLVKKLITHTTASGFKKSMSNNIIDTNSKVINDKPIVTGVELKKSSPENKDSNVIDTTPVNFKELTKAFGQDVCLRSKPKQPNIIQRSEFQQNNCSMQNGHNLNQCLTNVYQSSLKPKNFTSIAVNSTQNQNNLIFRNGINLKGNQLMPVVKGFKFSNLKSEEDQDQKIQVHVLKKDTKIEIKGDDIKEFSKKSSNNVPRSPTMPVITGVTLKSARPKSMPAQIDQRDILLESIRNFGGRENLKSATERC